MRHKKIIIPFLLGMACIFLSQWLLRTPLLILLKKYGPLGEWEVFYPLITGFFIALSAGVFEETGRFLFRKYTLQHYDTIACAIFFGLGHGLLEALLLLLPSIQSLDSNHLPLLLLERILAILYHIGASVLIWKGFWKKKEILYLFFTILLHGLINFTIPLATEAMWPPALFYGVLIFTDIFLMVHVAWEVKRRKP
ncbi:MAG: YhfC family glutamic-type intramembrane protease [Tissierellia bacterium]|nr:YhfC family glutamic-type intramembrane protease [Tissierellia bacterium]